MFRDSARALSDIISEHNVDVVYSFGHVANFVNFSSIQDDKRRKRIYVITGMGNVFHGDFSFKNLILKFVILLFYNFLFLSRNIVIVQNSDNFKMLEWKFLKRHQSLHLVYGSGISLESEKILRISMNELSRGFERRKLRIIFVSRISENKGVRELLNILPYIGEDLEILFYGKVDENAPIELVKDFQTAVDNKKIIFGGYVDNIYDKLLDADVYLSLSAGEGCSHTMVQALACGLPIVASSVPGNRDCVEEGENGFLVNRYSHEDIINRLSLLNSSENRRNLGASSRALYFRRFTREAVVKGYMLPLMELQ